MNKPTVERLLNFHRMLLKFSEIERVIDIKRGGKLIQESDSEHSYNLALMAWYLASYFPELSAPKVVLYALVHDLVEVHAGDTFVFADQDTLDSKAAREAAAQKQLATEWPDFPDLHTAIREYEDRSTPEAKFTYALDKFIPVLTIYLNDGYTWHDRNILLEQLDKEKRHKMSEYPELLTYWDKLYDLLKAAPELFPA